MITSIILLSAAVLALSGTSLFAFILLKKKEKQSQDLFATLSQTLQQEVQQQFYQFRAAFDQHQFKTIKDLQESLHVSIQHLAQHILNSLNQNAQTSSTQIENLTKIVHERLREMTGEVEKRLNEGFEKTASTFTDIVKRLALIDEAQKKISDLSTNVVSLQHLLNDKRSRGAFGEVQLENLIKNVLPEAHYQFQQALSNGKRCDCLLILPQPTGNIAIDAKFPLENYRTLIDSTLSEAERKQAEQRFRQDLKKHITDIAEKYIIEGETSDGAFMFIPAEAVFAEIHSKFQDIVELSQRMRVWMVSPTTMMAILTTASAVIKDVARRQQIHIIQEHLRVLGKDFDRFYKRMENLAKHIDQANDDAQEIRVSAEKLTSRFQKIEKVEIGKNTSVELELEEPELP